MGSTLRGVALGGCSAGIAARINASISNPSVLPDERPCNAFSLEFGFSGLDEISIGEVLTLD